MTTSGQSKLQSFVESIINTVSGFLISLAVWIFVVGPLFGIPTPIGQSLIITLLFTVSSIARSYIIRRIFNWYQVRKELVRRNSIKRICGPEELV